MSVFIGHASIDERGKAYGGQAGDQTGREVYIRNWYNGNWNVLLRPKSEMVAEKSAQFCEAVCRGNQVGYDQYQRNTLRDVARKAGWDGEKIATPCETDCSAFMTVCAEAAGVNVSGCYTPLGNGQFNAPVTQNMRSKFTATGAYTVLTDRKYLTSDAYLRRGDILVRESGHTAMVLSNGEKADTGAVPAATVSPLTVGNSYTVKGGDTLWTIAAAQLGNGTRYAEIKTLNGLSGDMLYVGQTLKIPKI